MPYLINPPPQSPLTRLIGGIVAVITLIGAFMLGMVALLVVAAVGLIAAVAIWLRVIWIKRQMRKNGVARDGDVIEAEYTVISKHEE